MHPKSPKWLDDIADASARALQWTAGVTLADYEGDRRLHSAVERGVGIVGSALLHLERTEPATAALLPEHQAVVDLRDHHLHHYDEVDHQQVWSIVHDLLPRLRAQAESLLAEAEAER